MKNPPEEHDDQAQSRKLNTTAALESLPIGVLLIDRKGVIFAANHHAVETFRRPAHQLVGMNMSELLPDCYAKILGAAKTSGKPAVIHVPELEGAYITAQPLKGRSEGLLVSIMDYSLLGGFFSSAPSMTFISQVFRDILDAAAEGLIIADSDGRLVFLNSVAAEHMGAALRQLEGLPLLHLREAGLADLSVAYEVFAQKRKITAVAKFPKADRTVFLTAHPLFAPGGSLALVLITERDLAGAAAPKGADAWESGVFDSFKKELSTLSGHDDRSPELFAKSLEMRAAIDAGKRIMRSHNNREVLLLGEEGTEKLAMAYYIHMNSSRSAEPFFRLNSTFAEEGALEAEIFGSESGPQAGVLDAVGKGTLYLENISSLSLAFQERLLELLDRREYRRAGGSSPRESRACLIFSSSRDPEAQASRNDFLPGLLERLKPNTIMVPPLRSRKEDILDIAMAELSRLNRRYGGNKFLDPFAEEILLSHSYPGNLRELKNAVHQAVLFSRTANIGAFLKLYFNPGSDLPVFDPRRAFGKGRASREAPHAASQDAQLLSGKSLTAVLDDIERKLLVEAAASCRSTREMAVVLGISQAGVSRKLKKYNLEAPGKINQNN